METGWSTITKQKTNFARLYMLLTNGGTHVLRKIFDAKHPPHELTKHLMDHTNCSILTNLKAKKALKPEQWSELYPCAGTATSANFDFSLLCLLLRNICNLKTPTDGWKKEPAASNVNTEDDIVRLRLYRNKLAHISEPALSDADFNRYWNDIKAVLLRLGADMAGIDNLRIQPMDPKDKYYIIYQEACKVLIHAVNESQKTILNKSDSVKDKTECKLRPTTEGTATSVVSCLKGMSVVLLRNICNLILVKEMENEPATTEVLRNSLDPDMSTCNMVTTSQPLPRTPAVKH